MNKPDDIVGVHMEIHHILNAVFVKIGHLLKHIEVDGQKVPALIDEWNSPKRLDVATAEEWALAIWFLKEGILQKFLHEVIYDNHARDFAYKPTLYSYDAWLKGQYDPKVPTSTKGN